jgi:hypothetical protein
MGNNRDHEGQAFGKTGIVRRRRGWRTDAVHAGIHNHAAAATVLKESDRLQINSVQYVVKEILTHTEQTSLQVECVLA